MGTAVVQDNVLIYEDKDRDVKLRVWMGRLLQDKDKKYIGVPNKNPNDPRCRCQYDGALDWQRGLQPQDDNLPLAQDVSVERKMINGRAKETVKLKALWAKEVLAAVQDYEYHLVWESLNPADIYYSGLNSLDFRKRITDHAEGWPPQEKDVNQKVSAFLHMRRQDEATDGYAIYKYGSKDKKRYDGRYTKCLRLWRVKDKGKVRWTPEEGCVWEGGNGDNTVDELKSREPDLQFEILYTHMDKYTPTRKRKQSPETTDQERRPKRQETIAASTSGGRQSQQSVSGQDGPDIDMQRDDRSTIAERHPPGQLHSTRSQEELEALQKRLQKAEQERDSLKQNLAESERKKHDILAEHRDAQQLLDKTSRQLEEARKERGDVRGNADMAISGTFTKITKLKQERDDEKDLHHNTKTALDSALRRCNIEEHMAGYLRERCAALEMRVRELEEDNERLKYSARQS